MTYTAPIEEQKFVLRHVAGIDRLAEAGFDVSADMADAIVEGVGAFAAGEFAPLNRVGDTVGARWSPDGVSMPDGFRDAYRAYVEGGWGTISAPGDFGGQDQPQVMAAVVLENLGAANMAFSLCPMLSAGAIEALKHHGTPEQQETWLPRLVTGEWTGTMNLTEPQAGSDVGALKTRADPVGDGTYRIKGQKIFITFGDHDLADNIVHLVLARLPDAPAGTRGISLFIVPKVRAEGTANDVRCVSIEHKLGIHASPTCVMAFGDNDDCIGELIGGENGGMRAMFTMMNNARLNVGLQGVSIAERATQAAVAYAMERVQSARAGAPGREAVAIIQHPDVRRMLLRMKALTQGARALAYYANAQADLASRGDAAAKARADLLTPLVKAWGTDVGCEVASLGVQVHGGMGFIEETGAAQHFRDIRIAPIYEGTNGIQAADLVGRKLGLEGGETLARLIADMRAEAESDHLLQLIETLDGVTKVMTNPQTPVDSRLAGSYPLLTMMAVAVAGWLMERQMKAADRLGAAGEGDPGFLAMKSTVAQFFMATIVPEAMGLKASALAGSTLLYANPDEAFAAA
ncbi:acyl-CoA dehydrogenase [Sphingosinicella sp. YJ22]|uniref:acyl-CoA dehydrogenase n=1 Tax=Sphingosinicella sp. YJ22 TaxID=1104780 RepID=UPI00140B1267|nr:acyl-CoA dehydrogenase [Sphingosinicella sp. YJ22]